MRLFSKAPFLALAITMPGGLFLRRTSAFVWSSAPQRTFAKLQQVRGGSSNFARLSTLARPATVEQEAPDIIQKEAKASQSIVGSSVSMASLQGVPYLDTKNCDEFRVLFVLGGPGAGKI